MTTPTTHVSREFATTVKAVDQRAREFAQQHPFAAVAAATLLGYLLGRLSSR